MQITADISKILKNVQSDLIFVYDVFSELCIGFVSFLVILLLVSQKHVFIENEVV